MTAILCAILLALSCVQPAPAPNLADDAKLAASEAQAGNRVQW